MLARKQRKGLRQTQHAVSACGAAKLPHKPAISHVQAVRTIVQESGGHFDPRILKAFNKVHAQFEVIFQAIA